MQYLYVLDLSDDGLEGTIPASVWTLPSLRFAYLMDNRFTGTIPQRLASPPSEDLEEIWLSHNSLSGEIPSWWTELPNLESLSVSDNAWTGPLPSDWSQTTKLAFLDASSNQLTGPVPISLLYSLPTLRILYLEHNQLTGSLTTSTEAQEELKDEFDFTVVVQQRANLRLEALWLQDNQLTGTIPRGFGWEWNSLRELELQGNQLTGIWDCVDEGSNVWPKLEEISVDCLQGPSLEINAMAESEATVAESVGGVDMDLCSACCIKCY